MTRLVKMAAVGRCLFTSLSRRYNALTTGRGVSCLLNTSTANTRAYNIDKTRLFASGSWLLDRGYATDAKKRDFYSVLNVTPHATQAEIKEAYYKLSMRYHPDKNQDSAEAHSFFTEITEAYSVLGQYETRRRYDKGVLGKATPAHHQASKKDPIQWSEKRSPNKPPAYDFDAFYKAHYGDALRREQTARRQEKEKKEVKVTDSETRVSLFIGVAMILLFAYAYRWKMEDDVAKVLDKRLELNQTDIKTNPSIVGPYNYSIDKLS